MTQNPNWPLIDVAVSFDTGPADVMPADHWCSVKDRTMDQLQTNRGRQYELDQVQTGTWSGSLKNTDAAFDPSNASSPFYPQVLPYRAMRHRAQYPATVNVLTADQSTAGKASGFALGTLPPWVAKVSAGAMTLTTATWVTTSNLYSLSYPASTAAGGGVQFTGASVVPGAQHAFSMNAYVAAATGLQMQASFVWTGPTGSVISTTTGTAVTLTTSPQPVKVIGAAPSNACGVTIRVLASNSVASATTVSLRSAQLEYNSVSTTYVIPNPWYSIFTGYMERWPQSWDKNGLYGKSNPTAVDAFGYLSQQKMLASFYEEVLLLGPTFFYPLDESAPAQPSIPTLFYDLTSNRSPVTIQPGVSPSSVMAAGDGLTATGGYLPQGVGGPVVGVTVAPGNIGASVLDMTGGGVNPSGPSGTSWTRMIAFRAPVASDPGVKGASFYMFLTENPANQVTNAIEVLGNFDATTGAFSGLQVDLYDGTLGAFVGTLHTNPSTEILSDGGWHFLVYGATDPNTLVGWLDGVALTASVTGTWSIANYRGGPDTVGLVGYGTPTAQVLAAEFACVAEFPFLMSSAQASALYSAFRYGGSGLGSATSGTRYQDILRWGSWAGQKAVDNYTSGQTASYGPATEMNSAAASPGTDVVSMLQTVVDTEAGFHYVAADGTVTFNARRARYNQSTPVVTFGEQSGEVPYTDVTTGYDPSRIANDISTVQTQTSYAQREIDAASAATYGDIQLQRTVNTLSTLEQADAAQYLLRRNSQPVQRVESISVDVGSNPSLWASMLQLELGSRVRVMRRPPLGAATIQIDGFVEQINWTIDDRLNATVTLQISVNNQQQYWQLDSSTFSVLGTTTVIGY